MANRCLPGDLGNLFNVLLICICIGRCSAGVVPRNFLEENNEVFALEHSEMGNESEAQNDTLMEVEPFETSLLHSSDFLKANGITNSSSSPKIASTSVRFTGNTSEVWELETSDANGMKLNEDSDSTTIPTSNETVPVLIRSEPPNNELQNKSISDNTADFGIIGHNGSFEEVSIKTDEIFQPEGSETTIPTSNETVPVLIRSEIPNNELQNKSISDSIADFGIIRDNNSFEEVSNKTNGIFQSEKILNETLGEDLITLLNESYPNSTLSLPLNKTERNRMEFAGDINDTIVETNESENLTSVNASEGIFSNFGFEFLKNSEVAKNVAMAMEVFNLTDSSLTDHIIEEKEFHGFLDPVIPSLDDSQNLNSTSMPHVILINATNANLVTAERVEENNTVLLLEQENNTLTLMKIETEASGLFSNLSEFENVNKTLDWPNLTERIEEISETLILNISVNGTDFPESTLSDHDSNNATDRVPKCPPTGICLFWFLSQDTCAENNHCLESQLCCRIGCSKTCVEIS